MGRFLAACLLAADLVLAQSSGQPSQPTPPPVRTTIYVTASPIEVSLDHRDSEAFSRNLFTRDDQLLYLLGAGISAGQHEGGGKSLEIRRFGFNLDHGGVNGGLKVLVDNVQQNQPTQGHGQGYLGTLKSISPELVQEVTLLNGPFSPEYGDFSGLGVVHIRLRESLPDQLTSRFQAGSFRSARGFLGYSPMLQNADAVLAYEGSYTDGPFLNPLNYRRDNVTGAWTRRHSQAYQFGFKGNGGRNDFTSSGQLPLDEVAAGRLDRFGYLDPFQGGDVVNGTLSGFLRYENGSGAAVKVDGFISRSLFDLYSNFTYFLNDPINGDGIVQHDSRLVEGANVHYARPQRYGSNQGLLVVGANYHDNQILTGLNGRRERTPLDVRTKAHARVTNGASYAQQSLSLLNSKLLLTGGLRYDEFRFDVRDLAGTSVTGTQSAGRWQPKAGLAFTPVVRLPFTLQANYGRGISTSDARVIVQRPESQRVATTDFYQLGTLHRLGRLTATISGFFIDRSAEQVYLADDGTYEFFGPSRAYGWETKLNVEVNRHVTFWGGITKVTNAFFRGTAPREYVSNAPHFAGNAAITLSSWHGWSGSLRVRSINRYRLDPLEAGIVASGHTVWDVGLARRIRRGVEFNLAVDNLFNRYYWETQNYYESRLAGEEPQSRIHGTPGYPITIMAGLTVRMFGK
jgi:outer membrane receptor protein involved in Fe transport